MRLAMRTPSTLLVLPVASLALTACNPPDTPFRYTALTPAARPIAWDGRGSSGGTLHIEGQASSTEFGVGAFPKDAGLHVTALRVSYLSLDGAILLEPVRGVQFGARATYSAYSWSDISTVGTMPLPSHPSLWGVGPEMRVWIPFDKEERFALGIAGNALFYQVPFAEWTQQGCTLSSTCISSTVLAGDNSTQSVTFQLTNSGADTHVVLTGGLYPSYGIGPHARYGSVFLLLGVTQGFSNDGFTDVRSSDGLISTYTVGLAGAGYGFRRGWFHVNAGVYMPFGDSAVNYAPGGWLTIGVDPRLWNGERRVGPITTDPEPYGWGGGG
jgi:hypothetical protein